MRIRRALAACALAALALPRASPALIGGMTGFSGITRPDGGAPLCNKCHGGGATPEVRIEGPQILQPNEAGTFELIIDSASAAQTAGGLDVAVTGGTLATIAGEGEQVIEGELTHVAPKPAVEGAVRWRFLWTAPTAPGAYAIHGAGNSVNADVTAGGDAAARATIAVVVPGDTFTPAPTSTPTPTPTETPSRTATATRTPRPCAGDCDGNRAISIDELIRAVHVSLDTLSVDACEAADPNGDGTVSIAEIVAAVDHSLQGCE